MIKNIKLFIIVYSSVKSHNPTKYWITDNYKYSYQIRIVIKK